MRMLMLGHALGHSVTNTRLMGMLDVHVVDKWICIKAGGRFILGHKVKALFLKATNIVTQSSLTK